MGGMGGGHYVAYTRHPPAQSGQEDRWCYCSDSSTHWVSVDQVLQCEAYILFYSHVTIAAALSPDGVDVSPEPESLSPEPEAISTYPELVTAAVELQPSTEELL